MVNNKLLQTIDSLVEKSREGIMPWSETGASDVYQASFSKASVRVGIDEDYNLFISILNDDGICIESATENELSNQGYTFYADKIRELYTLSKSKALGVDDVLDSLLTDIDGYIPF